MQLIVTDYGHAHVLIKEDNGKNEGGRPGLKFGAGRTGVWSCSAGLQVLKHTKHKDALPCAR